MSCYSEFCECFKTDDCEKAQGLIERYDLISALDVAAAYSTEQRRVSANMVRTLVREAIAEAEMFHAIWMLDEMINDDEELTVDGLIVCLIQNELVFQQEPSNPNARSNHRQLLQYIGICSDPEFDQLLSFVGTGDTALVLPDDTMLVTFERAQRRMNDDRTFFLALHSALVLNALEQVISELSVSQEAILNQLQEQGCEVEMVAGATNAFLVYPPDVSEPPMDTFTPETPCSNPSSGMSWVANKPRRKHSRRYAR